MAQVCRRVAVYVASDVLQDPPPSPHRVAPLLRHQVRSLLLACSVGGAVVAGLGVRTLVRTRVWETSESLYLNDGRLQPTSSKAQGSGKGGPRGGHAPLLTARDPG
jgi:hypothetical protein